MLVTLVLESWSFDSETFLRAHRTPRPCRAWRRRDATPTGRAAMITGGIVYDLAEADGWAALLTGALDALARLEPLLEDARAAGADLEVDFGVVCGVEGHITHIGTFTPAQVRRFAELGVRLTVSAYPGWLGSAPDSPAV